MDNAFVMDGLIAIVLLAGAIIGAKRGLFKSLMGLIVVAAALVGAVVLANVLTEPITDVIAPRVENAVVKQFSDKLDESVEKGAVTAAEGRSKLTELLEEYGLPTDMLDSLISSLSGALESAASDVHEKAADTFRGAISASVRTLVRGTVHAVLVLVLYVALLVALKLLTRALDHVFDLPVLSTLNGVGGAVLGFLEAALLLYVALYLAARFGVAAINDHAQDAYLLPLFLNHSPVEWISTLF